MNVKELHMRFISSNNKEPQDDSDLLQFAKVSYIRGELTIIEYRGIVKEIEELLNNTPTI
ncbi:YppF family protein [Bacillus pinisoli]|uniref:YppF family protein n=1 Tax=Bacillus pinisoli TaxID=2901866 RepID=UPI001FF0EAAF|nr:YppF family protein [Bacillus pinisoli]